MLIEKYRNSNAKTFRERAESLSGDNPLSVDHYHYFSHDDPDDILTNPIGAARTMRLKNGTTFLKYNGSYCYADQLRRTAISEHQQGCGGRRNCSWCTNCEDEWETRKLQTVRVSISSIICKLE